MPGNEIDKKINKYGKKSLKTAIAAILGAALFAGAPHLKQHLDNKTRTRWDKDVFDKPQEPYVPPKGR